MFMYLMTVFSVLLALPEFGTAQTGEQSFAALRFNYDGYSYISYYPDMSPMTQSFSVCLWIKKLHSDAYSPCPFAYYNYEIFMTDSGYYNRVFGSSSLDGALPSAFTTPLGSWYFYCSTWSLASQTFRIYHDGQLVGTETTSYGRTLQTGGPLVLGNYGAGSGHQFGGEMFNFNIFSRELTASEVASLSEKGLCTPIPESLEDYRKVKWEDILELSRTGSVWDTYNGCAAALVDDLKEELEEVKAELNLTQTRSLQKGNLTKWDVFYFTDYYEKTFTRDLYRQLVGTWDTISNRLFGMKITDRLIELIKDMDDGEIENCGDLDN